MLAESMLAVPLPGILAPSEPAEAIGIRWQTQNRCTLRLE
jgi:hypothetical protein